MLLVYLSRLGSCSLTDGKTTSSSSTTTASAAEKKKTSPMITKSEAMIRTSPIIEMSHNVMYYTIIGVCVLFILLVIIALGIIVYKKCAKKAKKGR